MKLNCNFWIATIFVLVQNGSFVSKYSYEGMDQPTIDSLLQEKQARTPGMAYQFVSQKVWDSTPDPIMTPPSPDLIKTQAITDAKNSLLTPQQRIDALIKAIDLK